MRLRAGPKDEAPAIIDARNVWRPADVVKAGLRYHGIGVQAWTHGHATASHR
jgi:UDPglucose 6-dehydrogenase